MEGIHLVAVMLCLVIDSPGDHQAFILDLHLCDMIGDPRFQVVCPPAHHLSCSILSSASRYHTLLHSFCVQHHLVANLDDLFRLAQQPNLNHDQFQCALKKFDRIKSKGMRFAEKRCHHLRMGAIQFSLELNQWCQQQELWHLVIRWRKGSHIWATTIR